MQQAALAHARLGGDGVERQIRDALAGDHGFGGVEEHVLWLRGCLVSWVKNTVRSV